MAEKDPALTGQARGPGVSWSELMARDSRPAPDCLTRESYTYLGSGPLDASR